MTTKAAKAEARARLVEILAAVGPEGLGTLCIQSLEHKPSSSGITNYCELQVWEPGEDGPRPTLWPTRLACVALGYRFNPKREAISMGGYGYCRATQIASDLHKLCGHPIRVEALGYFAGPRGWYPKAPQAQAAE